MAAILSGAMMLDQLGEAKASRRIDAAVTKTTGEKLMKSQAAGKMGMGTKEVGDLIAKLATA